MFVNNDNSGLKRLYQILIIAILILFGLVTLLNSFGPEVGFDALWYHLTIPKLYLEQGQVFHIPGGLIYYSEMPRLAELLFLISQRYIGPMGPHLITWSAAAIGALLTYKLARLYLQIFESIAAVFIIFVTPMVGWLSGSAYIDLLRTDFELLALFFVLKRKFAFSGLTLGLAASVKYLAWGSLLPIGILVLLQSPKKKELSIFSLAFLLAALPWIISSFLNTGYILYPIGAGILDWRHSLSLSTLNPLFLLENFWQVFIHPEDPITPIFVIAAPFFILNFKKLWQDHRLLVIYALAGLVVWEIIPKTGGGRFIFPYLPSLAILVVVAMRELKDQVIVNLLLFVILVLGIVNLAWRIPPLVRLKPYLLGQVTAEQELCRRLNPDTFVDCDGQIKKIVGKNGLVLVSGFHNLYYLDVPFVDESWYRGEKYNYVLTSSTNTSDPGILVYHNGQLGYSLYQVN